MKLIAQFGLFTGILVLLLVLAYSFFRNTNKIFLGLSLFFVWYSLLILWLNDTGLILRYAFLDRTGLIAAYLAFPFLFVYSRNTFYPGRLWRMADWILLVPAVTYIIDFMPFFLLSAERKNEIWRENLRDPQRMLLAREGWLGTAGFHFIFIYIWMVLIMYFQLRLIARNWNLKSGFRSVHNRRLLQFIIVITLLYLPLFVPGIFGVIFKPAWFSTGFIAFTYGLSLSTIAIYLLIFPNILYGFLPEVRYSSTSSASEQLSEPFVSETSAENSSAVAAKPMTADTLTTTKGVSVEESDTPRALAILAEHMTREKLFLKQGFTIQDLSNETGIPVYQLSPLINGHFKMNFTSWINRYRIEYFVEHAVENQHMTLEALARDSGFTSRSAFISAFKKEKNLTPSEYLKSLQQPST